MKTIKIYFIHIFFILTIISCDSGPKKIQAVDLNAASTSKSSTGIFDGSSQEKKNEDVQNNSTEESDVKTIEVTEVLPTDKYVYMKSNDGKEEFWVAAIKQEVSVGDKFFFKGGLLKTNFESKEYNRVFDKVYLVSKLIPISSSTEDNNVKTNVIEKKTDEEVFHSGPIEHKDGSIKISELIKSPESFQNQKIQLTGRCVKLNANIMGRNWIHLQDGTQDDYDLVITSDFPVPVGHIVTLSGIVSIDKDFGAGYKYDLIVENAELIR